MFPGASTSSLRFVMQSGCTGHDLVAHIDIFNAFVALRVHGDPKIRRFKLAP